MVQRAYAGDCKALDPCRRFKACRTCFMWALSCGLGLPGLAQEQSAPSQPVSFSEIAVALPTALPDPAGLLLPANTVMELELVEAVSSKTSLPDDFFKMRVAVPIKAGDIILIPVGTPAMGQVVHAQKSRIGGKAGELILAARYLEMPQGRIKLRSTFGSAGKDNTGASLGVAIVLGVIGLIVKGSELELPVGARLSARTATAVTIAVSP